MFGFGNFRREKNAADFDAETARLKQALSNCRAVVIGAGAGLSVSAGFTYSGERFQRYFFDFIEKYRIPDMYSGGFYPFPSPEEYWAWWSRHIYVNRYMNPPKPVYETLLSLVRNKDYFVLTTNVDHCFQKAGFDRTRLFYTQGDYGLFQSATPKVNKTYDNETIIRAMVLAQGFSIGADGELFLPEGVTPKMEIPTELLPICPDDGQPMVPNLRADDNFVEDAGWRAAYERYAEFLNRHEDGRVLYWELGVGGNTPGIIKFPFWRMTAQNKNAVYACVNLGETEVFDRIVSRSILIDGDIGKVLEKMASLSARDEN